MYIYRREEVKDREGRMAAVACLTHAARQGAAVDVDVAVAINSS